MSAAEEGAAAARVRGAAVAVAGAAEATPTRGVDPASAPVQVAAGSSPAKASNVDKASAVAGLLERWPSSAAALLAQTMACPDVSKNSNTQAGRVSVAGAVHGCGQSDLGMSPSMLNLLQSGAFMHAHPPSLLSAPQGQAAAAALMSQGCTPGSLNAADAATVPAHLSSFPGSDFWGVSALGAVSATSPPFLTNAAAASLLTAANVDSASLGCCFPSKLPSASAREQPQRVRIPQQRQQQQQQALLSSQHVQQQTGCSPQDQQLLSISPILMMMPPGGSGLDPSAPGGRVMGSAGEEPQPAMGNNPGAGSATVSRESLPKVVGVRYDKVNKTWRASWYDPQSKRRVERKFSVNKLGFINAYNLATECRKLQEKKLGLRDRSGRKQNQQQAESQAASAAMQQIPSPTARAAALAGAAFPRFDLHSTPAAAAAWEATAPTVSPHMDLSLLGPSLKAFSSSNTSSSSSSSSLSMPGAQAAALLPVESLLSLTEQQQQQLQRHHQLQQPQQLQQQQLRQQTCLQQALGEAPVDGQQLQHLGACADQTSVTPARSASDTSYLAQSIASAAEAERRAEKAVTSAAALGGATALSGPLSVLSPHLFDLGASRQQQQQQPQQGAEAYTAHHAATLRRSFQAFEGENPFISSSSSGQQLSQRSSHHEASARQTQSLYYGAEGHVATVKTPAESPSTPQASAVSSKQPVACATPISARRGEAERTVPAPTTEFKGSSMSNHGSRGSFAEKGHERSPPQKGTADHSLWEERGSRGEKRRLEQTTPQQQRRTAARLTVGSTHSAGSTPESSAVSQQHEKQPHLSQGQHSAADGGQQQAHVQSYDKAETNAASEHRLSVSFGTAALHVESGRQSTKSHEEGYVPDNAARMGSSDSFVAAFSPDTAPPSSVHSQKSDSFAYKLANRRCDSAAKSGRSTPSNSNSYQSAASGSSSRPTHPENHDGNWAPQNETTSCRRREMLADKTACEASALTNYSYISRADGPLQHQQHHGADLPAAESLEEPANVESLPSPVENSQGRPGAKNGRNSRTQGLCYDEKKTSSTRQQRGTTQQCLAGEQQRASVGRDTMIRTDDGAMCGATRQTTSDHHESQQCVQTNEAPPSRQQFVCPTDVPRSQERGREDGQAREQAKPPSGVNAGLQQGCAGNAAAPPRRKKQEALLSAASFFAPSSPLGGSPFSLAAYALAAAAGANDTNGRTGRRNRLSSFSNSFPEDRGRYGHRGIFPPVCGSAADCCCGRTCPVLQETGAGGAALVTRCRGSWCGCQASCGYKSSFWQKSALRGWQQLSDLKNEKDGQSACGGLSFVGRTEAKRFGSLRLPRQLPLMHHPSGKETRGEDEELHANKWHGEECWLPEGASASADDADVSPAALNDCSLSSTSTAAVGEACNYADAAVGRESEVLGKVEKNAGKQNGSKEVLGLVKELLLLLLQSLQEALTSLCKGRGASSDDRRETDALGDRSGGNDKRGHGWDRRSKTGSASLRPSPEVADSSSNSSTCDSDGTATESSSNDVTSSMTSKEALECAAAVERHTRHVRNAGEMDQLAVYTNLFQPCIRTRLVPTELPPLQLMHLLRQLMKAQLTEVNGCRQPTRRSSAEHSPSRGEAAAGLKEGKQRSSAQGDNLSASIDKSVAKSLIRGEPLREDDYVLPKAPPSYAGAAAEAADDSQDAGKEPLTLLSPPCSGHSTCSRGSYKEGSLTERLLRRNKDDELASVYMSPPIPSAAEESSTTACRSTVTTRMSQERRASFRKFSASSQATNKTCLSPDLEGSAAYVQMAAVHSEDPSRQENCSQNATECASAGEAGEASEETSRRTDQICDENTAAGNTLRTCSRFRMQPLHEHYTRSRGDSQKQSRGDRASGVHERSAQGSACESGANSAQGGNFVKTHAAGGDEKGSQRSNEQQHAVSRGSAAGVVCTTRQRPLESGDSPTASHSNGKSRAEKSVADFGVASHSFAERQEAESRLALLAKEILDEPDEALFLQEEPRWTSEHRGDSGNANVMNDGLVPSSATTQIGEDNVARHLLCEGVVGDDATTYGKHEKQGSAQTDRPIVPQCPSVSVKSRPPVEALRRSSRRSRSQGSVATRGTAASPTPVNARGTEAFEEDVEDVKKVEAGSESPTLTSEEPSVHVDRSGGPASREHEEPQSSLVRKTRTCRRARDCRVRDEEAGRAENVQESNAGKVFPGSSYGVADHRNEDSLEKLLL